MTHYTLVGQYSSVIESWTSTQPQPVALDEDDLSIRTSHWPKAHPSLLSRLCLLAMQQVSTNLLTVNGHKTTTHPLHLFRFTQVYQFFILLVSEKQLNSHVCIFCSTVTTQLFWTSVEWVNQTLNEWNISQFWVKYPGVMWGTYDPSVSRVCVNVFNTNSFWVINKAPFAAAITGCFFVVVFLFRVVLMHSVTTSSKLHISLRHNTAKTLNIIQHWTTSQNSSLSDHTISLG